VQEQRTLPKEFPTVPLPIKKDHNKLALDQRQPFVRLFLHVGVAGDDNLPAVGGKPLEPRDITLWNVINIALSRGVVFSALNVKIAGDVPQLVFAGKGLKDPHHRDRYVLVKRYLQAALRKSF
jgi:hypothetical protein